jgi:hypothetical protein
VTETPCGDPGGNVTVAVTVFVAVSMTLTVSAAEFPT